MKCMLGIGKLFALNLIKYSWRKLNIDGRMADISNKDFERDLLKLLKV